MKRKAKRTFVISSKLEDPLRSKDIGPAVIAVRHEGTRPSCNKGTAKNYEKAETSGKERGMEQKRERYYKRETSQA